MLTAVILVSQEHRNCGKSHLIPLRGRAMKCGLVGMYKGGVLVVDRWSLQRGHDYVSLEQEYRVLSSLKAALSALFPRLSLGDKKIMIGNLS